MLLSELAGKHQGETIWVLGSGPSLNFLCPQFFQDKITVSTNLSARTLGFVPDYVFTHYQEDAKDLLTDSRIVVTLAKSWRDGSPFPKPQDPDIVLVEQDSYTPPAEAWSPETHPPRKDSLVFGSSSIHGSMHLAAWLGASHIVLVGADCGTIDGENRVAGYPPGGDTPWSIFNEHHRLMKEYLIQEYGVTVYSLNPFINLNLEGHTFNGP
jgi:hypothetical protein